MRLRSMLLGAAVGAVVTFLFDRERGSERRARLREQAMSTAQRTSERLGERAGPMSVVSIAIERIGTIGSRFGSGGMGSLEGIGSLEEAQVDDATLVDRIRSEALGDAHVPAGEINVDAVDGVATLRGELSDPALIDEIVGRVRAVPGVAGVENLLHTRQQEPAKNKRAAIRASERAAKTTPPTGKAIE
jgi:osmotically-inducible protein OsmY